MEIGSPGWVGPTVALLSLEPDAAGRRVVARVWLGEDGTAVTDHAELAASWAKDGIVGRAHLGRLYPRDGQTFLDELPYMYRSAYLNAVPGDMDLEELA